MIIGCGPEQHKIIFKFELPQKPKKIGVMVSGGIDSAVLYYLTLKENLNLGLGLKHTVIPFSVCRDDQVNSLAQSVIDQVHESLKLPRIKTNLIVLDKEIPDTRTVYKGFRKALQSVDVVYIGIIKQLSNHVHPDFPIPDYIKESRYLKHPLKNLMKSHIIDLCYQFKQENLFHITNACDLNGIGRCNECYGCAERAWGFSENNKQDPGTI